MQDPLKIIKIENNTLPMKVQNLQVNISRKVLHEQNEQSMELGLQVALEPDEDPESVYYSLKNMLEGKLDTWEHEIRTNERPRIVTIPEMQENEAPPLITASQMAPKIARKRKEEPKVSYTPKIEQQEEEQGQEEYICPVCGEEMKPKEGKSYLLCSKHWAYPDMIRKGEAKERKY